MKYFLKTIYDTSMFFVQAMSKKIFTTLFTISVMMGALAMPAQSYAQNLDKVIMQIDWLPGGDKSFFYLGVDDGIYKKYNLDVTLRTGRGSTDAIMKAATGNADFASGGLSSLMMAKMEGDVPVKAVMSIYTKMTDAIFTVEGSGITDLASLNGKSVAAPPFSTATVLWPALLKYNKIDADTIKTMNVDPASQVPLLTQNNVQASLNWTVDAGEFEDALAETNRKLKIIPFSDLGLESYGLSLMASDKVIKERPDVVKRFLQATKEAILYANQHPEAAAKALKKLAPEVNEASSLRNYQNSIPVIMNEITERDGFGAFNADLVKLTWTWVAVAMGYDENAIDPESIIDRRFIPTAQ